jgi:predicted transcriptional regulator
MFRLFTLCSASVSALYIAFSNGSYESSAKWETLEFQREQIVGARLAGASVIKTAILLGVSRAAVSKVMMTYTNHGNTSSAKRKRGRKPKLSKKDRRTLKRNVSKKITHYCGKLSIHLEDRISTKIVRRELHKSNIHGKAAIATPLTIENSAKRRKRWCDDHKTWTSDDWKYVIWSDELFFTLFPTSGQGLFGKRSKKPIILNAWLLLRNMKAGL